MSTCNRGGDIVRLPQSIFARGGGGWEQKDDPKSTTEVQCRGSKCPCSMLYVVTLLASNVLILTLPKSHVATCNSVPQT